MRVATSFRVGLDAALLAPLIFLCVACSHPTQEFQAPELAQVSNFKVVGKVTCNGKPVTYGYVLFFGVKGVDKSGQTAPPAVGKIGPDGTYEVEHPVVGPVTVCVATDPDADVSSFYRAGSFLPGGGPPGLPGGPGEMPGDPGAPPGGPPGFPPGGPPGLPPGGPPMPPGVAQPKPGPDQATEKLTAEEKKFLKLIHDKYGSLGQSPLSFVVAGQSDQRFNIELSLAGAK